ncbi:MAG: aldehyde dehydrogenase family protein [Rhizobiaceae bacterium]
MWRFQVIIKKKFYVSGAWVEPVGSREFTLINPSSEEPSGVISLGDARDVDAAVEAAKAAFPAWSETPPAERLAIVERLIELYRSRSEEMGQAISLEMGAPIDLARGSQVGIGLANMRAYVAAFREMKLVDQLGAHAPDNRIALEPIGVVGLITPWNWPMNQVTLKVVAALLAGCTMVLKPSEIAPLSSMLFAELVHDAGVPAGVFNLVNGLGAEVGEALSRHPDVQMISFTGSTVAGIAVSRSAAETLKRVTLELGGKGANLIFADHDGDAIRRSVAHCFLNSGQSCNAPTRMLVEQSIYDETVEAARAVAEATSVDVSHKPGNHIGPVVSERQFERVQRLIKAGIDEGARLVAGGNGRPQHLNRGYFVRPTVFANVDNKMTIAQEEVFGPVLSIIPFASEDDAVQIANDTPYGLTNYVQTADGARRNRLARRLRSGMVEMNGQPRGMGAPFGGIKSSGRAREGGRWGIEEFMEVKAISGWAEGIEAAE